MSTALAALFHGPQRPLELVSAELPTPRPGEVLVSVHCCALCSSDLHTHIGRRTEPTPTVLGHEIVGHVLAVGHGGPGGAEPPADARGNRLQVGDPVTWSIAASCGTCPNCLDGLTQKCASLVKYGHERVSTTMPFRGGLAEVALLAPGTPIVKLPPESDRPSHFTLELASLANCSTSTVAAVLRTAFSRRHRPGMSVAVLGVGVLGLTACAMARALYQAGPVIAVDINPAQLERARLFGATHTCSNLSQLPSVVREATGTTGGVDVAIELAGAIDTCRAAVEITRTGGTVIYAGATRPTEPLVIEPQAIIRRLLRIEGVHNYTAPDLLTAVDFLLGPAAQFPFPSLLARSFPLTDINQAFDLGHTLPGQRVLVHP